MRSKFNLSAVLLMNIFICKTGAPRENPRKRRENLQTTHRNLLIQLRLESASLLIGCLIAVQLQTQLDQLISVFSITTSYWADVWTAMSQTWDVWFLGVTIWAAETRQLIIFRYNQMSKPSLSE
ncbi:uncharacterized protein isoform X2 [Danio rerio]|uniref:Uncharacterized protein isoform X2 n=1 Tax=Danio rerio TaxID=7955 RepID=A0AC58H2Y4_DANRE